MAVNLGHEPVQSFEEWYVDYDATGGRNGELSYRGMKPCADAVTRDFTAFKREMDARVGNYGNLEKLADNEVLSPKPDLPNISSGEVAGLVRRIARNLVQNCPNVEVISKFDDDSAYGIFARHILTTKIIGSDLYSNDMQQNLFASVKQALTLGFDAVVPALLQDAKNGWHMKYDALHYRDVFPEPGVRDVRDAAEVYVRRYLTQGEVRNLILNNTAGWDHNALRALLETRPPVREHQSVSRQDQKHKMTPEGYEIITRYTNDGNPFLTFDGRSKMLLRIEKNKHPLKQHPVHFLVLEKDSQQPLGKSQVELLVGRQEFQDLMLNGAMKLWYRNINPSIIGYGTVNAIPNLSPGKYTQISNPNAKVEAFEVNTQTLMQFGQISQQNLGSMVSLVGAADQQMAMQSNSGMSATPQGVEAQQAMVDITTNNYQKAIEAFFSHYCSYALTLYFQELKAVKSVVPTADARKKLLEAGFPTSEKNDDGSKNAAYFKDDGSIHCEFEHLATEYWVRCVPGSLTEMEDEKQLRILNELFIPLSQAMPALAQTGNQQMISQAAMAMSYIIKKQIELSGAAAADSIGKLWDGDGDDYKAVEERDDRITALESKIEMGDPDREMEMQVVHESLNQLQENQRLMGENMGLLLEKLGVQQPPSDSSSGNSEQPAVSEPDRSVAYS